VTPTELEQEQLDMKKHRRKSRPGPTPDILKASQPKDDKETRIILAIVMLRRGGKSASLIAIDKRVDLPIDEVKRYAKALRDAGLV
jgi:hypothetical protein